MFISFIYFYPIPLFRHQLVLHPFFNFSLQSLNGSSLLSSLVFTSHTSTNYTHTTHHIVTPIKEHLTGISLNITDITTSATDGYNNLETTQYRHCQLTSLPVFIQHAVEPKVHVHATCTCLCIHVHCKCIHTFSNVFIVYIYRFIPSIHCTIFLILQLIIISIHSEKEEHHK